MKYQYLKGLKSDFYEHPFDRKALNALEGTPGLEFLIRKFFELGIEKVKRVQLTGSSLKVTAQNLSELYALYLQACKTLDIQQVPELYIVHGDAINAYATGVEKPIIALNHGTIDHLDEEELLYIMGHELGHVKSNHILYHTMAGIVPVLGELIGDVTFKIGELLSIGLQMALLNWQRMSEFTSDRAGLLTCQNPQKAVSAMVKMAGLPIKYYDKDLTEGFIKQAKEFENFSFDNMKKIAKLYLSMQSTHPWTVLRCAEMMKWVESGEYERILDTNSFLEKVQIAEDAQFCPNCGNGIEPEDLFCGKCGTQFFKKVNKSGNRIEGSKV